VQEEEDEDDDDDLTEIQEEGVKENPPPLDKHQKITTFLNPLENIILQEEVWKAEPDDDDDDTDEEVHLPMTEFKIVNLTQEGINQKS
jgi:hypothetical protein